MDKTKHDAELELFSTCPPVHGAGDPDYLQKVISVAAWSERAGCKGILVYSDNSQYDPWLISQVIIQNTEHLCPLIAVQPVYMHPYTVAKNIATLSQLYRRRIYLNMVAGGFKNDLLALNDTTPHDERYDRLVEYTEIIKQLVGGTKPLKHAGKYYTVDNLRLTLPCPPELFPGIFISGSSEAGLGAAKATGATAIQYPKPVSACAETAAAAPANRGIRIGIISRNSGDDAWNVAHRQFPEDRTGQLTHQLAMKVSDSAWHKQLSELSEEGDRNPYWLLPFENYHTMCPYLVGDYAEVGKELAGYIALGYRTFITDVPPNPEELGHIGVAFGRALERYSWRDSSRAG